MRKNKQASTQTNRKMNDETYKLRRVVMGHIYEAKALVPSLPRVDVRITDSKVARILGVARMSDNIVWIPASTLEGYTAAQVRHVVFHELLHAVFGIEHNNVCPLMNAVLIPTTPAQQDRIFKGYAAMEAA